MTLESYPTIEDFLVRVNEERLIEFASASRGRLAGFPAWENADRDLRHFIPADVPLGTFDKPYEDVDEDWSISIFEQSGWVYVDENEVRFRVPTQTYLEAWAALIDKHNPIEPFA
ncbi:MAG TPA: hypothetical protein VJZ00_24925 [Thermoanaerobaculia bacterium]|nr:hypothetical protein [Thermoanaerobaculia bacterium]